MFFTKGFRKFSVFSALPRNRNMCKVTLFMISLFAYTIFTTAQKHFPPLTNVALERTVITDPSDSTCGIPTRNAYCISSIYKASIDQCVQAFCVQSCPNRTSLPLPTDLLIGSSAGFGQCVLTDSVNTKPASSFGEFSTYFLKPGADCYFTPSAVPVIYIEGAVTFAFWIWREPGNYGTIVQKQSSNGSVVLYQIQLVTTGIQYTFRTATGTETVSFSETLPEKTWTHLAIQAYMNVLSFYINGISPGYLATYTVETTGALFDGEGTLRIGQDHNGGGQFIGRIQNFMVYSTTLSNREIDQIYTGFLPQLRVQTECRCPASHPRVRPDKSHYCIPNNVQDNTGDVALRLNDEAHFLEFINDGDSNSVWISKFQDQIVINIDLKDTFQIFYVQLHFYSPYSKAIKIERRQNHTSDWTVWQYYADDCQHYFDQPNNGPLVTSTSVNCIQFDMNTVPYSEGQITFNLLSTEPVPRPAHNKLYQTPDLQEFLQASLVRITLMGHYYVNHFRHGYFGLSELIVGGRCDCNGHADSCDTNSFPYKCNCTADSYTEGNKCQRCKPLYNNKPYKMGDQINAYNCKPCECHDHADSCIYDNSLDLFPDDHDLGGGGVCQNCKHNTTGQFCDMCVTYFYRPEGKSKYDVDVCSSCKCFLDGVENSNLDCEKVGGQCDCKLNVEGRQCDRCKPGHFNLQASNPEGCGNCSCVTMGTNNGDVTCHPTTGVCSCKPFVRNDKCDACKYGYYNLTDENPMGCTPCDCNPLGATSQFCDPVTGQCPCKDRVVGRTCDVCATGYFKFFSACVPCKCNVQGTIPGTICSPLTGQCVCKANVQGVSCDECVDGAYAFGGSTEKGCNDCNCEEAGTVNSTSVCDKVTGNCVCKDNVQGMSCNQCKGNTFGLNITDPDGCRPCNCDPTGTQNGDTSPNDLACDQNTGECTCLANRFGRKCDDCSPDYYINTAAGGGCNPCGCDKKGTLPQTHCDSETGQCYCKQQGSGVTGRACNQCLEKYFSFNPNNGNCSRCDCYSPGSKSELCDIVSGQCECKDFVTGRRCDTCVAGSSHLSPDNPYGCSKIPAQQPPPLHIQLTSEALHLYWYEPDYPNGVINLYRLFRNGTLIFSGNGSEMEFNDTGLASYTKYTYVIEASNDFGSIYSPAVTFQTLPGKPVGIVLIDVLTVTSSTATLSWNQPVSMNGPLVNYTVMTTIPGSDNGTVQWTGTSKVAEITGLIPFMNYTTYIVTCTPGGCHESWLTYFYTKSAPPSGMAEPLIDIVGYSELNITWAPPLHPNGIIIYYELWMRGMLNSEGVHYPPASRIFHPGGQYNPRPTLSPQENALPPPDTNYIMSGLDPYTWYEFQVLAENDKGKTASQWVGSRTGEAMPLYVAPPTIEPYSSTAVTITWGKPSPDESRGIIQSFHLFFYEPTNHTLYPFAPPYTWKLLITTDPNVTSYTLDHLVPYTNYTFKVRVCNGVGCINSTESHGSTLQDIPEGLIKPRIESLSSSVIKLSWVPPEVFNGPQPVYSIEKTETSLSFPPNVIQGTRFPGGGYYKFPADTIPFDVGFTGIRFWFRTVSADALLMFAGSVGNQDEFIAVQFKSGRPWFLFDPQGCTSYVEIDPLMDDDRTYNDNKWHYLYVMRDNEYSQIEIDKTFRGCSSFVTPTNDEGLPYNDMKWHVLQAKREGKRASISIDNRWTGVRESDCATGTIIGPTSGVYIGGVPKNFVQRIGGDDSRKQVLEKSFQGCIKDVEILQQLYPVEVWSPLDWTKAETFELAFANWQGCPTNLDHGIHFMGQGYMTLLWNMLQVRQMIGLSLTLRTDMRTGLLFFTYGGPGIYFYLGLINGALHMQFSNNVATGSVTFSRDDISLCDGYWHTVEVRKLRQRGEIVINSITVSSGEISIPLDVQTVSPVFVGGIPDNSEASQFVKDNNIPLPFQGFGGCIDDLKIQNFIPFQYIISIDLKLAAVAISNINLDGCTPFHIPQRTCREDFVVNIYSGTDLSFNDQNLVPYSDYLYRVMASNEAGSGPSPWAYGRTLEGAPEGVAAPYDVVVVTGYAITAKWTQPEVISGLLQKYILRAHNLDHPEIPPVEAEYGDKTFQGQISNAIPHTNYSVKIMACTGGGCTESTNGVTVLTNQEAPEDVAAPQALQDIDALTIIWSEPGKPNGIITGYFVYMDGELIYTGGERMINITDLQVYTSYQFYLRACTTVGCTNSPVAALSTAQLPPTFVKAPTLSVLGTTEIEVRWVEPEQLNGVLERYVLFVSQYPILLGNTVYNNSDFFTDYVVTDLSAGTVYYITIGACTGGGCTMSSPSTAKTEESSPDGVQEPVITSPAFSELNITWSLPLQPNGHITSYFLYHNEVLIYQGLLLTHSLTGLEPFSLHTFRVVACTSKGCGSSRQITGRTMEAPPSGFVVMEAIVHNPRTINVKWTPPDVSNGIIHYKVLLTGLFYEDPGNWDYRTVTETRQLYNTTTSQEWVQISPVIPMSSYSVQINASNTAGFILSNFVDLDMPEGTPDGVYPPTLVSQTSTSVTATWQQVGRQNAKDAPVFVLQFRDRSNSTLIIDIFGPTTSYIYTKHQLKPWMEYDFRIKATNSHGYTYSPWVMIITLQDKPVGLDPPIVVSVGTRHVNLTFQAPLITNGYIAEYKIYTNGLFTLPADIDDLPVSIPDLTPFRLYSFIVEACTEGGCTNSSQSNTIRTRPDLPEGLSPPKLSALTSTSIMITWSKPQHENGLINEYIIERQASETQSDPLVITQILPSMNLAFVDESTELTPFTTYNYRILARNDAGALASEWATVTTMSAKPTELLPPAVQVTGPTSLEVTWQPPGKANGILEYYVIRLPEPMIEIRNTSVMSMEFDELLPFTLYYITVTACTDAGCTESTVVTVRTDPTVPEGQDPPLPIEVSQTIISVAWTGPYRNNGPNIRYELSRMKLKQPLEASATNFHIWQSVYLGTKTLYEDSGMPLFTTFVYRVTVYNDVGQLTSNISREVTTYGGFPRKAAEVTLVPINHTTLKVMWTTPDVIDLQGSVTEYKVSAYSTEGNVTKQLASDEDSTLLTGLTPVTTYTVYVTITIHGGASIISEPKKATTLDGAPEGIAVPVITVLSETSLRVSWLAPQQPNGEITGYYIHLINERIPTGMTQPGSFIINTLLPYTVYSIKIEVCTIFDCTESEPVMVTTAEALPQGVDQPSLASVSPTEVDINWKPPQNGNGIILQYDLIRQTLKPCSEIPPVTMSPEITKCTYVQCSIFENICGTSCYSGAKVCCDGVLHDNYKNHGCCGNKYLPKPSSDSVCCAGMFYEKEENYQCCKGRYIKVLPGEICCPDLYEDRVLVGHGDRCCGSVPYSSNGSQVCCKGKLYDGFEQQCCGGDLIEDSKICCGDDIDGSAYTLLPYHSCCDRQYVNTDATLCCTSDTGHQRVHMYANKTSKDKSNERCCGMEKISKTLSCCNNKGFNPLTHVCADISDDIVGCGEATVCPLSNSDSAFCDRCDYDKKSKRCGSVAGYYGDNVLPPLPDPTDNCVVNEDVLYTGMEFTFKDSGLQPFSMYQYAVSVVNSAGETTSPKTFIRTQEAPPEQVQPPIINTASTQLYVIELSWSLPLKPNGDIIRFILWRDDVELYRGMAQQYTDDGAILPYQSYTYMLTACTAAGCTDSTKVVTATAESKPEGVAAPVVQDFTSTMARVKWSPPTKPNGIIQGYILFISAGDYQDHYPMYILQKTLNNLTPYTAYTFVVQVCTHGGCTNSSETTVRTLADLPVGVDPPRALILTASSVLLFWKPPTHPNGEILFYSVMRLWSQGLNYFYLGMKLEMVENNLKQGETYKYFLITGTNAGNTSSTPLSLTMPQLSLPYIPEPKNLTVLSPFAIFVEWDMVDFTGGTIDQYGVVLNAGRVSEIDQGVGHVLSTTIDGLKPYMEYEVRVKGCVKGFSNRCGLGAAAVIRMDEYLPDGMEAPTVVPEGPRAISVSWKPPINPNGLITYYDVFYRELGTTTALLINRVLNTVFTTQHVGNDLKPYTQYEYKVVASNSQGDVSSPWSVARTFEAKPEKLLPPFVNTSGPFGFQVTWQPPQLPNGVITKYKITYRKILPDPSYVSVKQHVAVQPHVLSTSVSGLDPFSSYEVQLIVYNKKGNVSATPFIVQTQQSSPSGLPYFSVEKINTGTSLIFKWNPPTLPNGIITEYKIHEKGSTVPLYQGLNREFEFRRLQPFTEYFVRLEACTTKGCSIGKFQSVMTAEILPSNQPSPVAGYSNSTSAVITWSKPISPNGQITTYEVLRRHKIGLKRSFSDPIVIYKTMDTNLENYEYQDSGLQPFTEYLYAIKASNSKGSTQSTWQSVFTTQAAPEGILPPTVTHLPNDIHSLYVQWTTPEKPNGIIQSYNLQRNGTVPLSFTSTDPMEYTDYNLVAFTWYSYKITVCTQGGCTVSNPALIQTQESAPVQVNPPIVTILSSTALNISWTIPAVSNGIIVEYHLYMDDTEIYNGAMLSYVKIGLIPYQEYDFNIEACTSGGCTMSGKVKGRPDDDVPMEMPLPILNVLSSRSVEIIWKPPVYPNGIVNSYDVRRNGKLIYTEILTLSGTLKTNYIDYDLNPGTTYEYVVLARNNKGSVESLPVTAKTYSASPSGLDPPNVIALTSTSVQASWQPPAFPNGPIVNYTLFQSSQIVYSGGHTTFTHVITGLHFWTDYTFRVQACTDRGCELSTVASVKTLESKPEEQGPPSVLALANDEGAHSGVQLAWTGPLLPNGDILYFELYRRMVTNEDIGTSYSGLTLIYNGTKLGYIDTDSRLKPYSEYQYMVISGNRAGKVESVWQAVLTKEAPPEFLLPPTVEYITPTTVTIELTEPVVTNGIIRKYSVYVNNTMVSSSIGLQHTIGQTVGLKPNTIYSLKAEACTGGGCTVSEALIVQTKSTLPTGMAPITVDSKTDNTVHLSWTYPTNPNGNIRRFIVYQRTTCPPLPQPLYQQPCSVGNTSMIFDGIGIGKVASSLSPYTAYEFKVDVENSAGMAEGIAWVRAETKSSAPQYVNYPRFNRTSTDLVINWSRSFTLNGRLIEYILLGGDREVFRGFSTQYIYKDLPLDKATDFFITTVTDFGRVSSPLITYTPDTTGTTIAQKLVHTEEVTFYSEVWFIVLVSLIGALILFTLLACCCRKAGATRPYIRERSPLELSKNLQMYSNSDGYSSETASSGSAAFHTKTSNSLYSKDGIINSSYESGYHEDQSSRSRSYQGNQSTKGRLSDLFNDDDDKAYWQEYPGNGLFLFDDDSDDSDLPGYNGDTIL